MNTAHDLDWTLNELLAATKKHLHRKELNTNRLSRQGFIHTYCIYKTQKVATLKMPRRFFTKKYKDGTRKVKNNPSKS